MSLSATRKSPRIHFGTGAGESVLVVEKMRQAWAVALAVPVLWASTLAFPVMGLVYCLTIVALDRIEHRRRGKDP